MFPKLNRLHTFLIGNGLMLLICLFLFFQFFFQGCSKNTKFIPSVGSVFNVHPLPTDKENLTVPTAPKVRVVHSANSVIDSSQDVPTNAPVEATANINPNWLYDFTVGIDTLKMSIRKSDGNINSLVLNKPKAFIEIPEPPSVPRLSTLEGTLGKLEYHLIANKDLFADYWEVRAEASMYLFLGTSVTGALHYDHDKSRTAYGLSSSEARIILGIDIQF